MTAHLTGVIALYTWGGPAFFRAPDPATLARLLTVPCLSCGGSGEGRDVPAGSASLYPEYDAPTRCEPCGGVGDVVIGGAL